MSTVSGIQGKPFPLWQDKMVSTERDDQAVDIISRSLLPLRIEQIVRPRCFRLDMSGRHLKQLFIGFNQFAADTLLDAGRVENSVCIGFGYPHKNPSYFEIDDERVRATATTAVALSPTRRVRIRRPPNSGGFALAIPTAVLNRRLREVTGKSVRRPIILVPAVDQATGPGRLLKDMTQSLVTELEREGFGANNKLLLSLLEDAIISVLLGLPGNHSGQFEEQPREELAPRVVRQAEDYMAAHVADSITLSDLTALCDCSRSALFLAFKSSRGYTPMQFLASLRLDLARERLMQDPIASVTRIALESGFGNHGRFAKAYRARFDESPYATRVKYRGPEHR